MKGMKKGAFVFDSPLCLLNMGDIGMSLAGKKTPKTTKHNAEWIKEPLQQRGAFLHIFIIGDFVYLLIV